MFSTGMHLAEYTMRVSRDVLPSSDGQPLIWLNGSVAVPNYTVNQRQLKGSAHLDTELNRMEKLLFTSLFSLPSYVVF